jgi:hypothetical protein
MPLSTRCSKHPTRGHRAHCPLCVRAVENFTTLRKRRLEQLTKANKERREKRARREERRELNALLAPLRSKKYAARVRWERRDDGALWCTKHSERLAQYKNKGRNTPQFQCLSCSRARQSKEKRAAAKRRKDHDAKLGTRGALASPLAQLIKTGIAPTKCRNS